MNLFYDFGEDVCGGVCVDKMAMVVCVTVCGVYELKQKFVKTFVWELNCDQICSWNKVPLYVCLLFERSHSAPCNLYDNMLLYFFYFIIGYVNLFIYKWNFIISMYYRKKTIKFGTVVSDIHWKPWDIVH